MKQEEKDRLIETLDEIKKMIDEDQLLVCIIMANFQATWHGSPFELLGWLDYLRANMKQNLLTPPKSNIVVPSHMKH